MTTTTDTAPVLASEKQLSYIKSLLTERGMEPNVAENITKKAASALISTLLSLPKVATAAPVLASEKQVAFIVKLWAERYPSSTEAALQSIRDLAPLLTKADASKQINELLAMPKPVAIKPVAAPATYTPAEHDPYLAVAAKGDVHVVDGAYYRIHLGQHSHKPYAAKAVIYSEAVWGTNDDGTTKLVKPGRVKWVTAKGMIFNLSEATKATPAEAHAFGKMLGRCCFCSLQIDTPESVTAGYGPVCAANKGLPWGAVAVIAPDLGNVEAQEGCDRCYCGCKYWENDKCVDCGETFNMAMRGEVI